MLDINSCNTVYWWWDFCMFKTHLSNYNYLYYIAALFKQCFDLKGRKTRSAELFFIFSTIFHSETQMKLKMQYPKTGKI